MSNIWFIRVVGIILKFIVSHAILVVARYQFDFYCCLSVCIPSAPTQVTADGEMESGQQNGPLQMKAEHIFVNDFFHRKIVFFYF